MKKKLAVILAVIFFIFIYSKLSFPQQEYFRAEWQLTEDGISRKCYEVKIQNLYSSNLDFNLQAFFSDTNFPIEQINNIEIYEWKAAPKEFPTYTVVERCSYQTAENSTNVSFCWNETVQNGTEIKSVVDWKLSKMQTAKYLEGEKEVLKTNNYLINIPKYGSKPKYDDLGNLETENGIKKLKVCFNTPIVKSLYGYGSSGKIGIKDLNGNYEEDPWWNSTWSFRKPINITSNLTLYDYQVGINLTYDSDMHPNFTDIRFVNFTDSEMPYWIESKSESQWAYVWVKIPVIPSGNSTIYVYYGNPFAEPASNENATFIFADSFDYTSSSVDAEKWLDFTENEDVGEGMLRFHGPDTGIGNHILSRVVIPINTSIKVRFVNYGAGSYTSILRFGASNITVGNDYPFNSYYDYFYATHFYYGGGSPPNQVFFQTCYSNTPSDSVDLGDWSNEWYQFNFIWKENNATWWEVREDNGAVISKSRSSPVPKNSSNMRVILQAQDTSNPHVKVDYVFVRKFREPEPTYSIGNEEQNIDIFPPTYSSPGHNNTEIGFPTLFYIKFDDNHALHPLGYYIFSTNLTGNWVNDSAINFTTTPSWANVTKILYTSPTTIVGYRWYAWDNSTNVSNVNVTPIFTLTAVDTKAPVWFNNQTTGSSTYGPNNQHYYSVTWSDNYEPEAWIGAYFSTNLTGNWVNYTAVRSGNATTYTIVPPAGTHCWRFYAWDGSNNINATPIWCKTINKATPSPTWTFNPSSPITYSTETNASCYPGTTDSGYALNAWRNGTNISSQLNQYILLPAGTWNYTCSISETQNYTSASVTSYYTVNKAAPNLQLTITPSNSVVYPTQTTATGSGCPSQLACSLYRNNSAVSNPDTQTLPIGTYFYVYNTTGNENYTSASVESYLYVTEALNPEITIFSPQNTTYYGDKTIEIKFNVIHQTWTQISTNITYNNELIFSSSVSNNTNVTIIKATTCGTHFVNITATAQGSSSQVVYFTVNCGLEIEVFDEQSLEKICYNLAIMNETYTYSLNGTCNKTILNHESLPTNYSIILISNSSYISRTYYANLTQPYFVNTKAYLLQTGSGVYITTFVYSREEPSGVKNALTNAKRFINNSWVVVEQKLTDEQGKGYFYLYPWSLYRIEGMKGNKYKQIESYYPNPNYVLYIQLEDVVGEKNKTWVFDTVYVEIKPKERYVANITTFEFTVSAQENDLEYFGVKFYKYYKKNYTLLYEQEVSSSSGGTIEFDVNVTNHTAERFEFVTYFKRNNYDLWNFTNIYIPWQSHSILPVILTFFASGGFVASDFATHLIAIFIAFAAAAGIGRKEMFGGIKGASLIFIGVLAFFAIIGMVRWEFIIACGLVALLINFAKGLVI